MECSIECRYEEDYGVIAYCSDSSLADDFDDFLTEELYVFYEVRFLEGTTEFFFGKASCVESVSRIVKLFTLRH